MGKTVKAKPFDAVQAAVAIRAREIALSSLDPEEQRAVRQELRHTGRLRTKLLRGDSKPREHSLLTPSARARDFYSS